MTLDNMLQGIPRISVYIITYNQIDVIDRTLKSVLDQIDYVYEICVSDDHSTDGTWERLQEYSEQYPGLFKLNRNNPNLGIFENTEKVWTMPTGDIVHDLAGDDCVGDGWFKTVVEYIQDNNIDYKKELFAVIGDYQCIYPNGDSIRYSNRLFESKYDVMSLYLRGYISSRGFCLSKTVFEKFERVSKGKSHIAETAQDCQIYLFTTKWYYINQLGNIYYSGIGVSTKCYTGETFKERLQIMPYAVEFLNKHGYNLSSADKYLVDLNISTKYFFYQKSIKNFMKVLKYQILSFDGSLGLRFEHIRHILFAFMRRMPHSNPIQW